ncbi:MAG: ABC transporter substrate-binding protein [Actinomycetota bacterium]|nr:ABC transporter substrate-binding protein [Actinomycetota bacterium]
MGTGPFVFGQWRKGERLEFTANPNYFGGKVASPRLVFAFIPDENARVAALRDGSVDADASGIAPQNAQRLRTDGFRVVEIPGDSQVIVLPTTNPVLSDPAVRRTISLAVDRNALVSGSFLGAA